MKLLVDACTVLWLVADDPQLSQAAGASCRNLNIATTEVIERAWRRVVLSPQFETGEPDSVLLAHGRRLQRRSDIHG